MVESVVPGLTGGGERAFRRRQTGHSIPLGERFGGYHVTGVGPTFPPGWGNLLLDRTAGVLREIPVAVGELFDISRYPVATSDALAQMLHEHQVGFVNRALQASYRTRVLMQRDGAADEASAAELDKLACGTCPLHSVRRRGAFFPGNLVSDPAFRRDFLTSARRVNGAALKDLDGDQRLLRYRCSYMIYSPAFVGLPEPLKKRVLVQLGTVLTVDEPEFSYLGAEEKATILAILHETLPELAPAPCEPLLSRSEKLSLSLFIFVFI
jgi:hypothetical protein